VNDEDKPATVYVHLDILVRFFKNTLKPSLLPKAENYKTLAEAYVFGSKVLDTEFTNTVIETFIGAVGLKDLRLCLSPGVVYESKVGGDVLRRFIADQLTRRVKMTGEVAWRM
jgi:hypothetical protein